jgi:CRISPR system Cascade subunit CasE
VRPVTFVACQSVLELNLGHVTAQRAVLDPQFLHKMVMSGFYGWVTEGEPSPRAQLRVLHAARVDLSDDLLTIVVQSRVQPDWDRIARAALRSRPRLLTVEHEVAVGQEYSFRTIVHPTRDSGPNRRRRDLTDPKDVLAWLLDRLQPAGEAACSTDGRRVRRIGADAHRPARRARAARDPGDARPAAPAADPLRDPGPADRHRRGDLRRGARRRPGPLPFAGLWSGTCRTSRLSQAPPPRPRGENRSTALSFRGAAGRSRHAGSARRQVPDRRGDRLAHRVPDQSPLPESALHESPLHESRYDASFST